MDKNSIDKVNQESNKFTRIWYSGLSRIFLILVVGSIVYGAFSPSSVIGYISFILFFTALYFWAIKYDWEEKYPSGRKLRIIIIWSSLCVSILLSLIEINTG